MRRPLLVALLVAGVASGAPATVAAQDAKAPPGLSAADEYLETVPEAGGNSTVGGGGRPDAADPAVAIATRQALPAEAVTELRAKGRTGKDAAALAGRSAPRGGVKRIPLQDRSAPGRSAPGPLASIGRIATGSGGDGIGLLFPLLIVAGTLAVAGSALARRRDSPA